MEFLKGIRICNYRSIDSEGVELDNFGKVNVLIGKNNSGKSNILRFIAILNDLTTDKTLTDDFKRWLRDAKNYFNLSSNSSLSFSLQFYSIVYQELAKGREGLKNSYGDILNSISNENGTFLFTYTFNNSQESTVDVDFDDFYRRYPNLGRLKDIDDQMNFENTIQFSNFLNNSEIILVENFRRINDNTSIKSFFKVDSKSKLYNGDEIVAQIQRIKSPSGGDYYLEDKFNLLQDFLKDLLNNYELNIDISHNQGKPEIIIKLNKQANSRRSIDSVGTGIHQLIILAFSAVYNDNSIFCIEEPEIFIHPEVQRKFIRYLIENTNNQYFITTHSNSFINEEGLDVYRVWHDGHSTKVEKAIDSKSKSQILDDLGYQASDLLQTNFIIWVEGPSDRIYIRHWINCEDKKLVEGIHYTIMFYGGRLLSHLTIDDDEIEDFIKINKINRKAAIFIDSDKKDETDRINDTKQRIIDKFGDEMQCVLTSGREIENYIDKDILNKALTNLKRNTFVEYNLYTDIFEGQTIDKMKLAKEVVSLDDNVFENGGLKESIKKLVVNINKANNLA